MGHCTDVLDPPEVTALESGPFFQGVLSPRIRHLLLTSPPASPCTTFLGEEDSRHRLLGSDSAETQHSFVMEPRFQPFPLSESSSFSSSSSRGSNVSGSISSPELSIYGSIGFSGDPPDCVFTLGSMENGSGSSFEEQICMDPVLEFVNNMLMNEKMENQTCMERECLQYQAIANGFYEILNEGDWDSSDSIWNAGPCDSTTKTGSSDSSSKQGLSDLSCKTESPPEVKSEAESGEWSGDADLEDWLAGLLAPELSELVWPNVEVTRKLAEKPRYPWQHSKRPESPALVPLIIEGAFQLGKVDVLAAQTAATAAVNLKDEESVVAEDRVLSFVRNGDLRAEEDAKLYRQWSSLPEWKQGGGGQQKKKKKRRNGDVEAVDLVYSVDLRGMLVSCAQAVAAMDVHKANGMLVEIRHYASPHGGALQRLAHYFANALAARLTGMGGELYTASHSQRPSAAKMLKAYNRMFGVCPFVRVAHYFANHSILKAAEGATRLHIIDYGILYGVQWPSLISALAERPGGPPSLHITGVEFPQPGPNPAARVEQTGIRLAEYAKTYNVPFEFHAIADKWEDIQRSSLRLRPAGEEVLIVNCVNRLRHLMDETVVASSPPRSRVLNFMRSLHPDLVVTSVVNANHSAPFFPSRFKEAVYYYSSKFDMVECTVEGDSEERTMMEEYMGSSILNVVACEGAERVERPESYKQWQGRFQRAGFKQQPLDAAMLERCRALVRTFFHKDFGIHADESHPWMTMGWKGRLDEALCTWKPSL